MKMKNRALSLEGYSSLTVDGICHGVFVGPSDVPVEFTTTWQELTDELFEMNRLMGREDEVIPVDSVDDILNHLEGLLSAAEALKNRLKKAKQFDRDAWMDSNNGNIDHANIEDFIKEINCDH